MFSHPEGRDRGNMSTIFQAECNEFLVTSVVKIISLTVFPAVSRARVPHMRVFVFNHRCEQNVVPVPKVSRLRIFSCSRCRERRVRREIEKIYSMCVSEMF